jgi:hypothetical protein
MGIFDIFKKQNKSSIKTTENGVPGPTYLNGFTTHIENPKDLQDHEWRRQLKSPSGQTKFKIKYYGQLHGTNNNLIVESDFSKQLVYAFDEENNTEILLFDGCKHGYDPIFCDTYTVEQINNRIADKIYSDKDGNELFEIIISTYNSFDFEEEFREDVDENGFIKLDNGSTMKFEEAKLNAFDTLQIFAINESGIMIDIISEELA